jgi:heme exporter protein A
MEGRLRLEQITGVRGGRLLFEGLDLVLAPGEAAIVSGPNGAGKSSLLRIAAGLLRPAAGTVERSDCGLADEHLALDEKAPLARALGFWARLDSSDPAPGMEAMDLARLAAVPVRMLSAGQRKRATIARVIAGRAPLWLLDEPANGLDPDGQVRLAAAMAAHRAQGGAILAASHLPLGLDDAREIAL